LTTLISVKVDIIHIETGINESWDTGGRSNITFRNRSEFNIDLDFVILEGNQRKSKTRVSVEPELERDIQTGSWDGSGKSREGRGVTDHNIVSIIVLSSTRKLGPDVKPFSILLINTLSTDLEFNVVDENVTDVPGPRRGGTRGKSWQIDLEVHLVDQITITGDRRRDLSAEINSSVKGLLN
jgi:hypothetical protein